MQKIYYYKLFIFIFLIFGIHIFFIISIKVISKVQLKHIKSIINIVMLRDIYDLYK
jgi:hypothetical protein